MTVRFSDTNGTPLDRDGLLSEGAVAAEFALAWLARQGDPGAPLPGPGAYTAYTTRVQVSPTTGETAVQAYTDTGGELTAIDVAEGLYEYRFGAQADPALGQRTHTILVSATRTFRGVTYRAQAMLDFAPAGGPVTVTRELVTDAACDACHAGLQAHGGEFRGVRACLLCHSPQTTDPDTGNTLDFPVLVHKLHAGRALPSVIAGGSYELVGDDGARDYSTVGYPRELQACTACHDGANGGLHASRPTRAACGACHDDTSFVDPAPAGLTLHIGGPQATDANCSVCHPAAGGVAGVRDVHLTPLSDPASPDLALAILAVENTAPGQIPRLTLRATANGAPRDIVAAPLSVLRVTVTGPTTDYLGNRQVTVQGGGASGALIAIDPAAGTAEYTFPAAAAMPIDATGTHAFALEGYLQVGGARFAAVAPIFYAAVTDPAPVPRRQILAPGACDRCHGSIREHGDSRRGQDYCPLCHNPDFTNAGRVARLEADTALAESLDYKRMIHRIHRGAAGEQPYVLGGFPAPSPSNPLGTPLDFGEVRYPADLRACDVCHLPGTEGLPLAAVVQPSRQETLTCTEDPAADGDDFCDARTSTSSLVPAITAVCTACHDGVSTAVHALVMTAPGGGESCVTCHGPGAANDAAAAHRR